MDQAKQAKFVSGSTMRHVVTMTATGSVGLVAIFAVDALNLFYISMLGVQELAAAIGFASTFMFFTVSVSIGFTIATSAIVSRALGRGEVAIAARNAGASLVFGVGISTVIVLLAWPVIRPLLALMGASGQTLDLATRFLQIVLPSVPLLALGMGLTGVLRAVGDARRAMFVTLGSGFATAILDPILIFGLELGLDGAAISTVATRFVMIAIGLHGAIRVHKLLAMPDMASLRGASSPFFRIAGPAVLTQLATPVGNTYVMIEMARFGDEAVAGWAIVGRLLPVAFGAVFALSGSIGPILGQNYGAGRHDRLLSTMRDAMVFTTLYVLVAWAVIAFFGQDIAALFGATGLAAELVVFFCLYAAGSFLFAGALFVASAAFNNLGFATYSTIFNWGRSTLGTIPFVWAGASLYGAKGVVAGWGLGAVVFGIAAIIVCFRVLHRIADAPPPDEPRPSPPPASQSPFSTGKAASLQ